MVLIGLFRSLWVISMNNIAIDLEATQPIRCRNHGGAEYAKSIFRKVVELLETTPVDNIFGFYNPNKILDAEIKYLAEEAGVNLVELSDKKFIGDFLTSNKIGRLFSGLPYDIDRALLGDVQFIAAIHGLRGVSESDGQRIKGFGRPKSYIRGVKRRLLNPSLLMKKVNLRGREGSLKNFFDQRSDDDVFVVPCNYTKYSIEKLYGYEFKSQLIVSYCPQTKLQEMSVKDIKLEHLKKDVRALESKRFILSLNIDREEKNVDFSVTGFTEYIETTRDNLTYVRVGKPTKQIVRCAGRVPSNIVILNELNIDELAFLYTHCQCLVYPSISEGFGYPPIECMSFGSPVLSSVNTSLSEVFHQSAIFFNPGNIVDFQHKLQLIVDPEFNRDLRKKMSEIIFPISMRQSKDLTRIAKLILKGIV